MSFLKCEGKSASEHKVSFAKNQCPDESECFIYFSSERPINIRLDLF